MSTSSDDDLLLDDDDAFLRYCAERRAGQPQETDLTPPAAAATGMSAAVGTTSTTAPDTDWASRRRLDIPGLPGSCLNMYSRPSHLPALAATDVAASNAGSPPPPATGVDIWPSSLALAALLVQRASSGADGDPEGESERKGEGRGEGGGGGGHAAASSAISSAVSSSHATSAGLSASSACSSSPAAAPAATPVTAVPCASAATLASVPSSISATSFVSATHPPCEGWALELGAGVGVAGLTLARLIEAGMAPPLPGPGGGRRISAVALTDRNPDALALLKRNVAENCHRLAGDGGVTVERLAWEDPSSSSTLSLAAKSNDSVLASAARIRRGGGGRGGRGGRGDGGDGRNGGDGGGGGSGGSLALILGADLLYGGDTNGRLLLQVLNRVVFEHGGAHTRVLLAFGCRRRGSREHVAFLKEAASRWSCTRLRDDYVANVSSEEDADAIDLFEMAPLRPDEP